MPGRLVWVKYVTLVRSSPYLNRTVSNFTGKEYKQGVLRRLWNSWVPIPTGVGLTLLAVLQWRRLHKERTKDHELKTAKDWEIACYKALPLRTLSRLFGWISECHLPQFLRPFVYNSYIKLFQVNKDEIDDPLDCFDCLASFFSRKIKIGCRPITHHSMVSPVDGTVMTVGKLKGCQVEQVKGVNYSLKAFLGDVTWQRISSNYRKTQNLTTNMTPESDWTVLRDELMRDPTENDLYQCVIYLAPGDYHRFHSPVHWDIIFRRHFQGDLLSVNPWVASLIPGLLALNERVVYTGAWDAGFFSMTAVGATNVGSIRVYQDKTLHTNQKKWKDGCPCKEVSVSLNWSKGEEIGQFRLGSTVVLIWEASKDLELVIKAGDKVKVGQGLTSSSLWSRAAG